MKISYDKRSPMIRKMEGENRALMIETIVDAIALVILIIGVVWLLAAPTCARSDDRTWTKTDTAGEVVFAGLVAMDYGETRWFLTHSPSDLDPTDAGEWHETNPFLGKHPSQTKLIGWNVISIIGHAAISATLPQPYRRMWQAASIVLEGSVVAGNVSMVGQIRLAF